MTQPRYHSSSLGLVYNEAIMRRCVRPLSTGNEDGMRAQVVLGRLTHQYTLTTQPTASSAHVGFVGFGGVPPRCTAAIVTDATPRAVASSTPRQAPAPMHYAYL